MNVLGKHGWKDTVSRSEVTVGVVPDGRFGLSTFSFGLEPKTSLEEVCGMD